ncbi:MAG: hypothetical protein AAF581_13685 [Planctomycetota bacterium]
MADHEPIQPGEQIDDPVASSTWYVGIVGIFVLVATVAATDALFRVIEDNKYQELVGSKPYAPRAELEAEQMARLLHSGEMERPGEPGVTTKAMPIDQAMSQIVKENGR